MIVLEPLRDGPLVNRLALDVNLLLKPGLHLPLLLICILCMGVACQEGRCQHK
jgi:hypothetical protein